MNRGFRGGLRVIWMLGVTLAISIPLGLAFAQGQLPEPTAKFDAAHRVEFPSLLPPTSGPSNLPVQLDGYPFKPNGAGPFSAVVMGHPCNGIRSPYPGLRRWVDRVVSWGHVVLMVDSLTTRGANTCLDGMADTHTIPTRAADAFAGLRFLATRSFVDVKRVAAMSWGDGGPAMFVALEISTDNHKTPKIATAKPDAFSGLLFRGAVALYPNSCFSDASYYAPEASFYAPVLWLIGENGIPRWMAVCISQSNKLAAAGVPISVQAYPNATFGFDLEYSGYGPAGDPIRYDPAATADAAERVKQFLAENLR